MYTSAFYPRRNRYRHGFPIITKRKLAAPWEDGGGQSLAIPSGAWLSVRATKEPAAKYYRHSSSPSSPKPALSRLPDLAKWKRGRRTRYSGAAPLPALRIYRNGPESRYVGCDPTLVVSLLTTALSQPSDHTRILISLVYLCH